MIGMVTEKEIGREAVKTATDWKPAIVPALALITVGVLPGLLKGLYEPYVDSLMSAYVSFGMLFMIFAVGGLSVMMFRDLASRKQKVYRLAPDGQPVREADGAVRVESEEQ
jgi:hypothetical protein